MCPVTVGEVGFAEARTSGTGYDAEGVPAEGSSP